MGEMNPAHCGHLIGKINGAIQGENYNSYRSERYRLKDQVYVDRASGDAELQASA
jgi:hypothetical protein